MTEKIKYYKLSESQLLNLLYASNMYYALESGGVDNWWGYDEARGNYLKQYEEDSKWELVDIEALSLQELSFYDEFDNQNDVYQPINVAEITHNYLDSIGCVGTYMLIGDDLKVEVHKRMCGIYFDIKVIHQGVEILIFEISYKTDQKTLDKIQNEIDDLSDYLKFLKSKGFIITKGKSE